MGIGEGLQLLDPAQGGGPVQPAESGARVGHHAEGKEHTERAAGIGGGLTTAGGKLTGQCTGGHEHERPGRDGQGEEDSG